MRNCKKGFLDIQLTFVNMKSFDQYLRRMGNLKNQCLGRIMRMGKKLEIHSGSEVELRESF